MTRSSPEAVLVVVHGLADLPELHEKLAVYGREHGLPVRAVREVQVALEEHLTNVFKHGCPRRGGAPTGVRFQLGESGLHVEVQDQGIPFNPLAHPAVDTSRPIEERPLGGLGIHMMRHLVDDLDYRREGEANVLTFRKRMT